MLLKFDFELRILSFSWTSRSSGVRGERSGDPVNVPISGSGCYGIVGKAVHSS
jgi:hypothetical protein